ncbi:CHRD domain-containing protein [Aquipuribacter nitratireducens]|uniref:CHRD domain-containing protein n=1 Tax=Aquipuribacter nitratireducens TaxID=650104 RepID=A0ABW0GIU3_9MICO
MRRSLALVAAAAAAAAAAVALSAPAAAGGRPFDVDLLGAAEVPGPGDPDGSGTAGLTINPGRGEVCYTITVADVDPVLAGHIHVGTADVAGPVVVNLAPQVVDGTARACVAVDRDLALAIIRDPAGYYVNLHNATYPAGALRGQLG